MRTRTWIAAGSAMAMAATTAGIAVAAGTGTVDPPPRIAFVARGDDAADALAVGPIAGRLGAPLYTTSTGALVGAAEDGLVAYGPELVIIAGGNAAVSEATESQIEAALGLSPDEVVRAAGKNRFETATQIAALIEDHNPAFLPADGTAADADLLDGLDSTAFLRAGDPVDADTLDGIDSTSLVDQDTLAALAPVQAGVSGEASLSFGFSDLGSGTLTLPDVCAGDPVAEWTVTVDAPLTYELGSGASGDQAVEQRLTLSRGGGTSFDGYLEGVVHHTATTAATSLTSIAHFVGRGPGEYTFTVQAHEKAADENGDDVQTVRAGRRITATPSFQGCVAS